MSSGDKRVKTPKPEPSKSSRKVSQTSGQNPNLNSRAVALRVMFAVLDRQTLLDEAFAKFVDMSDIEPRDRAFVRLLVTVTLRRLGQLDDVIARFLDRPLKPSVSRIQHLLRLGAAQMLFLDTPPHAAVGTAVDLAGRERDPALRRMKGLVNAVLRRVDREGAAIVADQDAACLNTPRWLWQSWEKRFGADTAQRIAGEMLIEPALDLTLHPDADREELVRQLDAVTSPTGGLRIRAKGRVSDLAGYHDGQWWVQDAAAALPVQLLAPGKGERVLDLCTAPGGKLAQIAAAGAHAIGVDISPERLGRVRENLLRLNLDADLMVADAASVPVSGPVDRVLLDAPCTATGTLRRHPDGKWMKTEGDVANMVALQARLLRAAVDYLKSGGTLVYCVCSMEAAEGPDQISGLLKSGAPVVRDPIRQDEVHRLHDILLDTGDVQTLPFHGGGMDGFFISRLKRL